MDDSSSYVNVADLQVGMYIYLDLSWLDHPFPQSSFRIRSADQIETIRTLRLQRVRWSPSRSDQAVGPATAQAPATSMSVSTAGVQAPQETPAERAERERAAWIAAQRQAMRDCQKALGEAVRKVKGFSRNLHARPVETGELARELVDQLAGGMLAEADLAMRLMADQIGGESHYHHALNVTLLSLMLARTMNAPKAVMQLIGLGALFHDIGKFDIPDRITRKTEPLTRAEATLLQTHAHAGGELARRMGLSPETLHVIVQHHEMADGSGYPRKLKGSEIALPARIVALVNAYDNLCNPLNPRAAVTPHEALALLYGKRRAHFDDMVLNTFVRCMGVYPPGSLVQLTDDRLGVVVSVHSSRPLRPVVLLFDPTLPSEQAPLLDLEQQDATQATILKVLRPQEVSEQVCEYLRVGRRTPYYFTAEPAARPHPG